MKTLLNLAILIFSAAAIGATHNFQADLSRAESKEIDFTAIGKPSALKIRGKSEAVSGNFSFVDGKGQGELSLDLRALKTGIELRDNHMKEKYLEVDKFSDSKLKILSLDLKEIPAGKFSQKGIPFLGELNLHGVTKPVSGKISLEQDTEQIIIEAQFSIKITDYSIQVPSYMGITVTDEVQIDAHIKAPIVEIK